MTLKNSERSVAYWRRRALTAELSKKLDQPTHSQSEHEIVLLRETLNAIENSRSWKITAPLRSLTERLMSFRRWRSSPKKSSELKRDEDSVGKLGAGIAQYAERDVLDSWRKHLDVSHRNEGDA